MTKKLLITILLLITQLYSHCIYIPCAPSVTSSSIQATNILEEQFKRIETKIKEIKEMETNIAEQMKKNNTQLTKNKNLKIEYLKLLKEANSIKTKINQETVRK